MKNRHKPKKIARWAARSRNRSRSLNRSIFVSYNFSDVEDNADAFGIISRLAAHAGNNAAAEAKAAGLSRVYIRNYKDLVRVSPGGDEVLISPRSNRVSFYVKYHPSTILHAVKK